ncbi:LysR substrate-binding domain-containing protein [Rhodoferax sp. GW822-FHT02A01]|uniref:LysR substrate-binding domain-containing protein n=1 Tax=Rhodoferax sp. GW822-FHT02A01 TaxID=3141537 RepID=UPI00315C9FEC
MRRKLPSSTTLLCFEAAVRHRSLTRAAVELSLTQSAISRQIIALEEYLGVALFRRTRHGMEPTAAGSEYAARVAQRLDALEQDTLDVMGTSAPGGDLHLACMPTFAVKWLIPRLGEFSRLFPGTTVHMDTCTRPFMFSDGTCDAAIFAGTLDQMNRWAGTEFTKLLDEKVVAVCNPRVLGARRKLKPEALTQMPLLQQSTRPDAWRNWFQALGVDAPNALAGPRYELFSMTSAAAAQGLGVALVPHLLVEAELARGELALAHPTPLPSERGYFLVLPMGAQRSQAVLNFIAWVRQALDAGVAATQR